MDNDLPLIFNDVVRNDAKHLRLERMCTYLRPLAIITSSHASDLPATRHTTHHPMMRFRFIDRITQIEPGQRIEAVKHLSGDERYLDDHFPKLPLMPGVLMLEAMYQAGLWLVRRTENFAHSVVLLNEARNVKFSGLVQPGQSLVVTADIKKQEGDRTTLVTQGTVDGKVVASARLVVEAFHLGDRYPHGAQTRTITCCARYESSSHGCCRGRRSTRPARDPRCVGCGSIGSWSSSAASVPWRSRT